MGEVLEIRCAKCGNLFNIERNYLVNVSYRKPCKKCGSMQQITVAHGQVTVVTVLEKIK